jgi:hypothetical protein
LGTQVSELLKWDPKTGVSDPSKFVPPFGYDGMSPGEQSSWKHDRSLDIAFEKAGDLVPVESPGTFCSCTKENYLIHNMLGALNVESIDDIKETFENQMIQACLFTSYMVCVPVYSKACSAMMASTPVLTFGGEQSFSGSSAVLGDRIVIHDRDQLTPRACSRYVQPPPQPLPPQPPANRCVILVIWFVLPRHFGSAKF